MKNSERNLFIYNLQFDEYPVFTHLLNQPINQIITKRTKF